MLKALAITLFALLVGCTKQDRTEIAIDTNKIELTVEEQQYIAAHPEITWALEDNRPPFVYIEDNKIYGISQTYLQIISKKTGLKFKPVRVGSLYMGLQAVKGGQVDLITSVRPTTDRVSYLDFTAPYVYNGGVFVFRQSAPPSSPLRAGICKGDAVNDYLTQRFPEMVITQTTDIEESIALLEKGLLDIAVMNEASADYLSRKSIIKMTKASTDFDYPYSFGFRKEDQILGSILTKAISSISVEDKNKINLSWKE